MEIKFRGRDKSGNVFFGSYDQSTATIDDFEYAETHAVNENTVAQLVAHDSNGAEIYEGDTVVDRLGIEYVARRITVFVNDKDCIENYDNGKSSFTLKQEGKK